MNEKSEILQALAAAFRDRSIVRARSIYFHRDACDSVIEFCRTHHWAVIGLEGFHVDGDAVLPDLNRIADLSHSAEPASWTEYVQACATSAHRIIEAWADDPTLIVNITVTASRAGR